MKVLFKNTTKYNKKNCNNLTSFHINKYGTRRLIKYIIYLIVIIYMVIFNIIHNNWLLILVIILISSILYLLNKYIGQNKKKREVKQVKEFTFYFYKNYIKIKYKKKFDRILYWNLKKIFETEEYFFLYVDEDSSLILDKKGFEIGTTEGFSEFIKRKCPLKYKNEIK